MAARQRKLWPNKARAVQTFLPSNCVHEKGISPAAHDHGNLFISLTTYWLIRARPTCCPLLKAEPPPRKWLPGRSYHFCPPDILLSLPNGFPPSSGFFHSDQGLGEQPFRFTEELVIAVVEFLEQLLLLPGGEVLRHVIDHLGRIRPTLKAEKRQG